MPKKDKFHQVVIEALEKDNWVNNIVEWKK